MATDTFSRYRDDKSVTAVNASEVTPSDSTDLSYTTRALYIGGDGDVSVIMAGGQTVTFVSVFAGTTLAIRVNRVLSANTTATNIVALW